MGRDWVTATAKPGEGSEELRAWGYRLVNLEGREGNDVRPWRGMQYVGWRAGQVTCGERGDGAICILSGAGAERHGESVTRMAGNVTRLDLQVTIDGVPAGTNLAGESLRRLRRNVTRRGRPTEWDYRLTRNRGATLYLGSRQSTVYARLYDKSAEEGGEHLGGTWRYELEAKSDVALSLARGLVDSNSAHDLIVGTVHEHFSTRGIAPAFDGEGGAMSTTPHSRQSDDERRLAWLRDQVSVVVARLGAAGRADDVAAALDPLGHYLAVSDRVAVDEWGAGVRALRRREGAVS